MYTCAQCGIDLDIDPLEVNPLTDPEIDAHGFCSTNCANDYLKAKGISDVPAKV